MKVDATALFVKTTSDVFRNNGDVFKNNAVASTFVGSVDGFGAKVGNFWCEWREVLKGNGEGGGRKWGGNRR